MPRDPEAPDGPARARWWLRLEGALRSPSASLRLSAAPVGSDAAATARVLEGPAWERLRSDYLDALDASLRSPFAVVDRRAAAARAGDALRETLRRSSEVLFGGWLPDFETHDFRVLRSEALAELPVAPMIGAARPELVERNLLPFDLHPRLSMMATWRWVCAADWPSPSPPELTILVSDDLNAGALLGDVSARSGTSVDRSLAAIGVYLTELDDALSEAVRRGAEVIRGFTPDDLVDALYGAKRPFVQVIAHIDEEGPPAVVCGGGVRADLAALRKAAAALRAEGCASEARALDLSLCSSGDHLAPIAIEMGVHFVANFPNAVQLGWLARCLRRTYRGGFLDGRTWFSHAWIRAALRP